jgi:hydrogenase maturation protein HypF
MTDDSTYRIRVKGLVQGVGFRPFIYRIAHQHKLCGWVENSNDGVLIEVNTSQAGVLDFVADIRSKAPPASNVTDISFNPVSKETFKGFEILKSRNASDAITDVSPDIAVCDECLSDMRTQPHRMDYPFINCTNCGPRFTIIRELPYDRDKTTMEPFDLCPACRKEYEDVLDRRFHAQPVACTACGPSYELIVAEERMDDIDLITGKVAELLETGKIVAVKGVGGFQLACDAGNEDAVARLRRLKNREGKPFAVMFRDTATLKVYTTLLPEELRSLTSWRKPIVIVGDNKRLAPSVSVGFQTVGAMLPYMPFHYLLFEKLDLPAIVLTSGNVSDEPIVISNGAAAQHLSAIADALLIYNRDIHNRTDDSVVMVVNGQERMIRRSRGYSPEPVNLGLDVDGLFAAGAELVNCFALGKGRQAILSQHIGDLKNLETLDFFAESFERYKKLFRVEPELIVHDLHPDYLSTRFAREQGLPLVEVQHHHAHIASGMAEHGLDEKVIGISMDGTGLGDDGHIWGGEFLVCDLAGYDRFNHFEYIPLPGGDKVTGAPWRTGFSYLYKFFGPPVADQGLPFLSAVPIEHVRLMMEIIDKKINAPLSCSAGRLFDAVAAVINACTVSKFHAEAPMRLEAILEPGVEENYPFEMAHPVSFRPAFEAILQDLGKGLPAGVISARFHNTFINVLHAVAMNIREETGLNKVVLSGGTFQNRYVLGRVEKMLEKSGFGVFAQGSIPSNDGGIALGQLAIAAKRRASGKLNPAYANAKANS